MKYLRQIARQLGTRPYLGRAALLAVCLLILLPSFFNWAAFSQQKTEETFVKEVENEVIGGLYGKRWEGEKVRLKVIQLLKRIQIKVRVSILVDGQVRQELKPLQNTRVHIRNFRDGKLLVDATTDDEGQLPETDTKKVGVGEYSLRPITTFPKEPYYYASNFDLTEGDQNKELELMLDFSSVIYNVLTGKPVNGAMIKLMRDQEMVTGPFEHFSGSMMNPTPTGMQMSGGAMAMEEPPRFGLFDGEFQFKNPGISIQAQSLRVKAMDPDKWYWVGVEFPKGSMLEKKFLPVEQTQGQWWNYEEAYKGQQFRMAQEQPVGVQVPLIPRAALKVTKLANKTRAQVGDLIAYKIKVENMGEDDTDPNTKIQIVDEAPVGLKYLPGTARINGLEVEPRQEGNRLVFDVDPLKAKGHPQKLDQDFIVYMTTLATSAVSGQVYENKAFAEMRGVKVSNVSSAVIRTDPSPFADESLLIGKVFIDTNRNGWQDEGEKGVGGIRLIMEDGTIVITDPDGKYSVPAAKPGRHVIKLDTSSLPEGLEPLSDISRFLNISKGLIIKQNFTLKEVVAGEHGTSPPPLEE